MTNQPFSHLLFHAPIGETHGLEDIKLHLYGVLKMAAKMRSISDFHAISSWSQSTRDGARVDVTYNESRDEFVFQFNYGHGHLVIEAHGLEVLSAAKDLAA